MKKQLNEVQKLQKIAGILKENVSEAKKSNKDIYLDLVNSWGSIDKIGYKNWKTITDKIGAVLRKLSNKEILELIKESGVSLNSIKKELIKTFRDDPFSDRRDVNSAIQGVKIANSIEQMGSEIEDYSGGFFQERDFYLLVLDLIGNGTIK
jgi:hypothetical protein